MDGQLKNHAVEARHHSTIEGEAFWQSQMDQYQKTELNRKAYCQKHNLNYNRFQYWFYKLVGRQTPGSPKAIPVKLKNNTDQETPRILCTLECGQGKRLLIHDLSVVSQLIARFS